MRPIVRNIQNSDAYEFLGGNRFRNLRTGNEGEVSDEKAKELFKVNVEATEICNEYPIVFDLIKSLNLKIDKK